MGDSRGLSTSRIPFRHSGPRNKADARYEIGLEFRWRMSSRRRLRLCCQHPRPPEATATATRRRRSTRHFPQLARLGLSTVHSFKAWHISDGSRENIKPNICERVSRRERVSPWRRQARLQHHLKRRYRRRRPQTSKGRQPRSGHSLGEKRPGLCCSRLLCPGSRSAEARQVYLLFEQARLVYDVQPKHNSHCGNFCRTHAAVGRIGEVHASVCAARDVNAIAEGDARKLRGLRAAQGDAGRGPLTR